MANIQKVLTSHFGSLEIDVVQVAGQPEPGITRRQLGEMLGYENPVKAIKDIHARNAGRFQKGANCAQLKIPASDGKFYDTYFYSFKGVLEICRYSNQPNANAVMDWAWDTLDNLRKGECPVAHLEQEIEILRQMLEVFEKHSPAKFFDYDETAALCTYYRKPPFGREHLKRWLVTRKILCKQAAKNEKPIQHYLDIGWFIAVIHEWYRKGKQHTENRYYITPKGLMGIIDMMIRDNMLHIPGAPQKVFPQIYPPRTPAPLPPDTGKLTDERSDA